MNQRLLAVRSLLLLGMATLSCAAAGAAGPGADKTAATLREFVFDVPVSVDDRTVGELTVVITGTDLAAVDAISWEAFGRRQFSSDVVDTIAARAVAGRIPIAAFGEAGLEIRYDPARLLLYLQPKRDQRVLESLSVQQRSGAALPAVGSGQGMLSAYVNVRALRDHVTGGGAVDASGEPLRLFLDGAVSFLGPRGAVLEWSADHNGTAAKDWTRGEVRLIHDDPVRAIRYAAGDVNFQTTEFQGAVPMLGLSVERLFSVLQPSRVVASTGQRSFVLSRPSRVTIYINGTIQRAFQLEPGRYSLSDFTAADGANEVRIEVEDNTGEREVIEFTLFLDATLLRVGESEFSVNAGFRRKNDTSATIDYAFDRPAWSGFLRYGITDFATVGASYQGEPGLDVVGVEAVAASPWGNFFASLNLSRQDRLGTGSAATGRWTYDFGSGPERRLRRLDVSTIYTSDNYAALGIGEPRNRFSWQTQARLTTPLPFGAMGAISGRYARNREDAETDETRIGIVLTKRFGAWSASIGAERLTGSESDVRGFVTLFLPLGHQRGVSATWQTQDNRRRLEWSQYPTVRVGNVSGSVGMEASDLGRSATADLSYIANRFIAQVEHDIAQAGLQERDTVQRTRLQFETALAFAGGHVAVGRPIADAFAIVSRHGSLNGSEVLVDPTADGPVAVADGFGPAVVPSLLSYRPQQVTWDAPHLPMGYDLGDTVRQLLPTYRSGSHYQAGSAASLTAIGVAVRADGSPLSLVAGEIRADDGRDFPPSKTFTNRSGRFAAQALAPGAYTITFMTDPPLVIHFNMKDDGASYVDLGTLSAKEK